VTETVGGSTVTRVPENPPIYSVVNTGTTYTVKFENWNDKTKRDNIDVTLGFTSGFTSYDIKVWEVTGSTAVEKPLLKKTFNSTLVTSDFISIEFKDLDNMDSKQFCFAVQASNFYGAISAVHQITPVAPFWEADGKNFGAQFACSCKEGALNLPQNVDLTEFEPKYNDSIVLSFDNSLLTSPNECTVGTPAKYEVEFKKKDNTWMKLPSPTTEVVGKCRGDYDAAPSNLLNADYRC